MYTQPNTVKNGPKRILVAPDVAEILRGQVITSFGLNFLYPILGYFNEITKRIREIQFRYQSAACVIMIFKTTKIKVELSKTSIEEELKLDIHHLPRSLHVKSLCKVCKFIKAREDVWSRSTQGTTLVFSSSVSKLFSGKENLVTVSVLEFAFGILTLLSQEKDFNSQTVINHWFGVWRAISIGTTAIQEAEEDYSCYYPLGQGKKIHYRLTLEGNYSVSILDLEQQTATTLVYGQKEVTQRQLTSQEVNWGKPHSTTTQTKTKEEKKTVTWGKKTVYNKEKNTAITVSL